MRKFNHRTNSNNDRMQMWELPDKDFKVAVIKMLQ